MTERFLPGTVVYAKDGRRYIVDDFDDGIVYCSSPSGAETEFPMAQLKTEAEWAARSGKPEIIYGRIKQSRAFAAAKDKLDSAAVDTLLARAERLYPGILDFAAFAAARRALAEIGNQDLEAELSIVKCREIFDAVVSPARATVLATLIGAVPERLVGAAGLGDNLLRAIIDKGLPAAEFEEFRGRRRR
jgi:hypothetical protein